MPTVDPSDLRVLAANIFRAFGASEAGAQRVAESLVEANLVGHDSHGVMRIKEYVDAIRQKRIAPNAEPKIIRETVTTLSVDGGYGFGQVIAAWTMERLVEKAKSANLAAASIVRCGHIGRLGAYVTWAAERGYIGLAFANGGGSEPRVAPHGGRRPVFGTNPLAAAIPCGKAPPIVVDFSTAAVASGKIRVAKAKGELLPEGWILDREGRPSRRPDDYYEGGMLLPAAGHKGYGLALLVEVLAGILTGAGSPTLDGWGVGTTNGVFFLVLKVSAFLPLAEFMERVVRLGEVVKAVPAANPNNAVLLPGEPEARTKGSRQSDKVEIPEATWQIIQGVARSVGVDASARTIQQQPRPGA